MKIEVIGAEEIEQKLSELADVNWDDIQAKQGADMLERSDVITPYRTGNLRQSAYYGDGEFGYTADYAPDVNYGHRTKSGGYVEGRHFLEEIVNAQAEKYREDVLKELEAKAK